jgi:tetratricopeptide (TPR) repeat protein
MGCSFVRHIFAIQFFLGLASLMATPVRAQFSQNEMLCFGMLSGKPDEQIAACTAVIEAGGDAAKLCRTHCTRASHYKDAGYLDQAIVDFDESVRLDPKNAFCRGLGKVARNAFDPAIADFDEALALDPNSASAILARGLAFLAKGDVDRAIADFDEAIRLEPANAVAFHGRGVAMMTKRDYNHAIDDFRHVI